MSDTAQTDRVKSCLIIDTLSLYRAYNPKKIDYSLLVDWLNQYYDLKFSEAFSNFFDPWFGDVLMGLGINTFPRKHGHQFDLVEKTIKLADNYDTILLFTEETYASYVKVRCAEKGSTVYHIALQGDIKIDDSFFREIQ